jgi:hypothetical protein
LKRVQHEEFGKEIRKLLGGTAQEKQLAGIIASELKALKQCKEERKMHPREKVLHGGDLAKVHELQLYNQNFSARVYFTVTGDEIVMLGIDPNKRQTKTTKEWEQRLLTRLHEGPTRQRAR